jgi:hypothetical protein
LFITDESMCLILLFITDESNHHKITTHCDSDAA